MVLVLARDLAFGQLTLRAMGLVYTTLLSLVPLLALSFSVLKAFGVYNQVEPVLLNFLAPLGEMTEAFGGRRSRTESAAAGDSAEPQFPVTRTR